MRWLFTALLGSALIFQQGFAEIQIKASGTRNGVPIPQSEIKFRPYAFGKPSRNGTNELPTPPTHRMTRRANAQYSSANWCGSVNHTPSSNKIKRIEALWTHPGCTKRTGHTYPQAIASWTGIDGDSVTSAIIQAGTTCVWDSATASVRHEAWWQWYPSTSYALATSTMPIDANDWINVTIQMTNDTAGTITITNATKGIAVTLNVSGGSTLARVDAVWTVERPGTSSGLAGFPVFNEVWFANAQATRNTGSSLNILGAKQFYMSGLCSSTEYSPDPSYMRAWQP